MAYPQDFAGDVVIGCIVAFVLIVIYRTYTRFRAAEGKTSWLRFMAVFRQSQTILWARILSSAGLIAGLLANGTDFYNNYPGIKDAISQVINPSWGPYLILIMGIVTEYLRTRPVTSVQGTPVTTLAPPIVIGTPSNVTAPSMAYPDAPPPIAARE